MLAARRPRSGAYNAPDDPLLLEYHFHLPQLECRALLLSRNLPIRRQFQDLPTARLGTLSP